MKNRKKNAFFDFWASLCFVFDVDWNGDFADDDYVLSSRTRVESHNDLYSAEPQPRLDEILSVI